MNRTIAALMTCHNRKEMTLRCLGSLVRQVLSDDVAIKTYVVDDGSDDGTGDAVKRGFPEAVLLRGDGHLYWGGGMRLAFSEAMKDRHDFFLWINDDVTLSSGALAGMLKTYQELRDQGHPRSIIVGSTRDPRTGQLTYGGFLKGPWYRPIYFKRVSPGTAPRLCDTMSGNCVLIPDAVAQVAGNIDATFTQEAGDLDYGLRAKQKGCTVWLSPGFAGTCARNSKAGSWDDRSISLVERIKKINDPKYGLPCREWKVFARRYAGFLWFFWVVVTYSKVLIGTHKGKMRNASILLNRGCDGRH